jgi:hypothetical protein
MHQKCILLLNTSLKKIETDLFYPIAKLKMLSLSQSAFYTAIRSSKKHFQ